MFLCKRPGSSNVFDFYYHDSDSALGITSGSLFNNCGFNFECASFFITSDTAYTLYSDSSLQFNPSGDGNAIAAAIDTINPRTKLLLRNFSQHSLVTTDYYNDSTFTLLDIQQGLDTTVYTFPDPMSNSHASILGIDSKWDIQIGSNPNFCILSIQVVPKLLLILIRTFISSIKVNRRLGFYSWMNVIV
jgi:hypothetical protein